jgi:6-pyruvoyltetrahydropterin/6-carboxytetrahydropterin synthase
MTYAISKDFTFSASHVLRGLPDGHPCGRVHGHNYTVRATLTGAGLDDVGMLLDYRCLGPFGRWMEASLDHRHLNDVPPFDAENPTAENLARVLALKLPLMVAMPQGVAISVAVSETPKTWATWTP